MQTVYIIEMLMWGVVGVIVLNSEKVSKIEFGLIWITLMAHIVSKVIEVMP